MKISSDVQNRLIQLAEKQGLSIDDLLRTLLDKQPFMELEILERTTDAFYALDNEWRFVYINSEAETLLQKDRVGLIGKVLWDEFLPARNTMFYTQFHQSVKTQLPTNFIEFYEPFESWFEVHIYPSKNGLSVYFRDVTLRKNLELALQSALFELEMRVRERTTALEIANDLLHKEILARKDVEEELQVALNAERELGKLRAYFVSMVSHEFRTPLASIRTSTDLIKNYNHRMTDMQRLRHLEKIQGQVSHLTNLLETTLLFGKSQTKKLELYFEETDFKEFCQRIVVDMQSIAGEKHFIRLQVDGDRFTYHLDKQLTYVLITNLITNSIKYSPKGGDIWIRVMCNKNLVQIAVQDAGIGIPPDDLARLFEDFYRAKNVGSIGGTGLGLTLVKHIVDSYHGTITIESAVDVGTTFTIQLPLCSGVISDKQQGAIP